MKKILFISLVVTGFFFLVHGFASEASRQTAAFAPSVENAWLVVDGVTTAIAGGFGLLRRGKPL